MAKDNGNVDLDVDFSVKKTGLKGTGKGIIVVQILDDDFEPVFTIEKGFTVGADASGAAKKEFNKTFTATGKKADKLREGVLLVWTCQVDADTFGLDTDPKKLKEHIKDWSGVFTELYKAGWVVDFDWPSWTDRAAKYVSSPELLASADIDVIQKLLTTHVRSDRFCDGHLVAMFQQGHIVALLRRLKEIRLGSQARPNKTSGSR